MFQKKLMLALQRRLLKADMSSYSHMKQAPCTVERRVSLRDSLPLLPLSISSNS